MVPTNLSFRLKPSLSRLELLGKDFSISETITTEVFPRSNSGTGATSPAVFKGTVA